MDCAIEICDLRVEFKTRGRLLRAVDGLSLCVERGRVFGFIGPNGAGKTTTMQVLLGFIPATGGSVRVFGRDPLRALARQRLGYMPEHPEFHRFLSAREMLAMCGGLFGLSGRALRERTAALLERVGLTAAADRRIGTYSRGMLQRLGLAQALINNPELVILDEPTSGFDPLGRIDVRRIIEDLRLQGCTVFFSSHELSEVEKVCDRVGIIAGGRLLACGAIDALVQPGESLERYFIRMLG